MVLLYLILRIWCTFASVAVQHFVFSTISRSLFNTLLCTCRFRMFVSSEIISSTLGEGVLSSFLFSVVFSLCFPTACSCCRSKVGDKHHCSSPVPRCRWFLGGGFLYVSSLASILVLIFLHLHLHDVCFPETAAWLHLSRVLFCPWLLFLRVLSSTHVFCFSCFCLIIHFCRLPGSGFSLCLHPRGWYGRTSMHTCFWSCVLWVGSSVPFPYF